MSKVTLGRNFQPCQCCQPGITPNNRFSSNEIAFLLYERQADPNYPEYVADPMVWSKLDIVSGQWKQVFKYTHYNSVRCWMVSYINLSVAGAGCYKAEFRNTKNLFSVDTHGICTVEFLRPRVRLLEVSDIPDIEIAVEGSGDIF